MSDQIKNLLNEGRISQYEYDIYNLYEGSDLGRRLLKDHLMNILMEEPKSGVIESFAWLDGAARFGER